MVLHANDEIAGEVEMSQKAQRDLGNLFLHLCTFFNNLCCFSNCEAIKKKKENILGRWKECLQSMYASDLTPSYAPPNAPRFKENSRGQIRIKSGKDSMSLCPGSV